MAGMQLSGPQPGRLPPAPAGYTYEPNTGRLIPLAGSATDVLQQRTRTQGIEDTARDREIALTNADRAARDALRTRLTGMLDRPELTSSDSSYSGSSNGGGRFVDFNLSSLLPAGSASAEPGVSFNPSQFTSTFGPSSVAPPPTIGSVAVPDTSAAQANIFARAKDKVGQETAGSLTSLRSALAGRGMLGGGAEVRGAQNILQAGQGQLGDTTREQAIQEGQRLTDFAKIGYEGAISQRGQDITARGQDINAQEAARDAALKAAQTGYEGEISQRGQNLAANQAKRQAALEAALTGYQGQITQRGQDISAATARADAARQANTTRNASITSLLGKLY